MFNLDQNFNVEYSPYTKEMIERKNDIFQQQENQLNIY